MDSLEQLRGLEIPGRVALSEGNGELVRLEVSTPLAQAEVYLHGAHIAHFQKRGAEPLLFLSRFSRFAFGQAIRGGVPVIFPWFGAREGEPAHGFARHHEWKLTETFVDSEDAVRLRFALPECVEGASWPPFSLDYTITISDKLRMETTTRNLAPDTDFTFEICLHTYLAVRDVSALHISGLKGVTYRDKTDSFTAKLQNEDPMRIQSEVDRIYLDTTNPVEVRDPGLGRIVRIEKFGSASTVVWNPWSTKAQQMPDFGHDEYLRMVCVESGNVDKNRVTLRPGQARTMGVTISEQSVT